MRMIKHEMDSEGISLGTRQADAVVKPWLQTGPIVKPSTPCGAHVFWMVWRCWPSDVFGHRAQGRDGSRHENNTTFLNARNKGIGFGFHWVAKTASTGRDPMTNSVQRRHLTILFASIFIACGVGSPEHKSPDQHPTTHSTSPGSTKHSKMSSRLQDEDVPVTTESRYTRETQRQTRQLIAPVSPMPEKITTAKGDRRNAEGKDIGRKPKTQLDTMLKAMPLGVLHNVAPGRPGHMSARGAGSGGVGSALGQAVGPIQGFGRVKRKSGAPSGLSPGLETSRNRAPNTENYDRIKDNDYRIVHDQPLSTFSIDVDTAAYANSRRFIEQMHRLPPRDAVRIEEFINYFNYAYPQPDDAHPFSVTTEVSNAPWHPKHQLVHIGIQGKAVDLSEAPPSNLVFLVDVSGSMKRPNKLPLLVAGFKMLVHQLRPQDRVAIVVYAGRAGLVLPSTSGAHKGDILRALNGLQAGGSTAGGAGIKLAYRVAQENFVKGGINRVILATDGDFNVGTSSTGELTRLVEKKRETNIFLSILGFGRGNYKDARMEKLSNAGNGNAAYIDTILEARKVLVKELGGTLMTIAKDVKLQVEFNPALVKAYRLIGYKNRVLAARDFNDDKKDAGELGAGHTVTALYEIIPADSAETISGVDPLKYQVRKMVDDPWRELLTVKLRYKEPTGQKSTLMVRSLEAQDVALTDTSNAFRFSSAVAEYGMLLKGGKHRENASYDAVLRRAKGALGSDTEGYRADFIQLVRKAQALAGLALRKNKNRMAK
jgi:Ca-activated chloride channel family protein